MDSLTGTPAKRRIFIGSSSGEAELVLASRAKKMLEPDFDVTVWSDRIWDTAVFRINQNFFSDLIKASLKFDFGILLGTADDTVIYHDKVVLQPRDNVLFELGLFTGRLGTSKCAFVVEKDLKMLSDLEGITLSRFDKKDPASFKEAILRIKDIFLNSDDDEINFFPSATLAATYFENLISPVCKYLIKNKGFEYDGKKYSRVILKIVMPNKISADVNLKFEDLKKNFSTNTVSFNYEGRPRNISIDTRVKDNILELIDFPTIISGINYAISNLLPNDFHQLSHDYNLIVERELNKFINTLKQHLARNEFDGYVVFIKETEI
jgi:hypothetical protein